MPLRSPKWPFTPAAVEHSPDEWGGVYVLWRGEIVLFIGSAPDDGRGIKADLLAHLKGELELLKEHLARYRSYPRCNQ
ncbi:MAG TPA: hypothetical protein VEU32_10170 [Burkholderiales bacterium]|nr:hypothetical protein [Burkholderiales bacterium]